MALKYNFSTSVGMTYLKNSFSRENLKEKFSQESLKRYAENALYYGLLPVKSLIDYAFDQKPEEGQSTSSEIVQSSAAQSESLKPLRP